MLQNVKCKYADIPVSLADFTIYTPGIGTLSLSLSLSLSRSHISSGENSEHFLQVMPFINLQFSFHQVPISAGWAEAVWSETFA